LESEECVFDSFRYDGSSVLVLASAVSLLVIIPFLPFCHRRPPRQPAAPQSGLRQRPSTRPRRLVTAAATGRTCVAAANANHDHRGCRTCSMTLGSRAPRSAGTKEQCRETSTIGASMASTVLHNHWAAFPSRTAALSTPRCFRRTRRLA
jgi:hypothetical protein